MTISVPEGRADGSVLVLMLVFILLVIFLGVLIIDLARGEYVTRIIQRSADAASLAAATELVLSSNSDTARWKNAKRAAVSMLRENLQLTGYELPDVTQNAHHKGDIDACETMGYYRSQILDNGQMRLQLERGLYIQASGNFVSLEDSGTCNASNDPLPDAMRVTVTIFRYPTVFAVVSPIARSRFGVFQRQAIGSRVR